MYIPYKSEYFKIAQSVLCNTYVGDWDWNKINNL